VSSYGAVFLFELEPLPPGVCGACCGEGHIYPELWLDGHNHAPCDDSTAALCVACKGDGLVPASVETRAVSQE
jgi:hypothetical protein